MIAIYIIRHLFKCIQPGAGTMPDIKIHISFQGGGAKLVPLLATAAAYKDYCRKKNISIGSVSGTSAGAFAAAIIAYDIDINYFRQKLYSLGKENLKPIKRGAVKKWFASLRGNTFYDANKYKELLDKLFKKDNKALELTDSKIKLNIFSANLSSACHHIYTNETDGIALSEAIYHSSALPFIFHNHNNGGNLIDGGWVNNLPIQHLLDSGINKDSILAVSFPKETNTEYTSQLAYLLSLINLAIQNNVEISRKLLSKHSIFEVSTSLGTLDFEEALDELKDDGSSHQWDAYYNAGIKSIKKWLRKYKESSEIKDQIDRQDIENKDKIDNFISTVFAYHSMRRKKSPIEVEKRYYVYNCRSLYFKDKKTKDRVLCHDVLNIENDALISYAAAIMSGDQLVDTGDYKAKLSDKYGKKYKSTTLVLPRQYRHLEGTHRNVLILPNKNLPQEKSPFNIQYHTEHEEVMYDILSKKKQDYSRYFVDEAKVVKELYIVFNIPKEIKGLGLDRLPKRLKNDPWSWIDGEEMTKKDFREHEEIIGKPEDGYRQIGWKAYDLEKGAATGCLAYVDK